MRSFRTIDPDVVHAACESLRTGSPLLPVVIASIGGDWIASGRVLRVSALVEKGHEIWVDMPALSPAPVTND
jgi:hypothetical protein